MKNLIEAFRKVKSEELAQKERIVERLLSSRYINVSEAAILLKTINIDINTNKIEMSSGAKIVGGSDFENHDHGRK